MRISWRCMKMPYIPLVKFRIFINYGLFKKQPERWWSPLQRRRVQSNLFKTADPADLNTTGLETGDEFSQVSILRHERTGTSPTDRPMHDECLEPPSLWGVVDSSLLVCFKDLHIVNVFLTKMNLYIRSIIFTFAHTYASTNTFKYAHTYAV